MESSVTAIRNPDVFKAMVDQTRPTIDDDPSGGHYMAIMDHTGDTKVIWSKDNSEEVEEAKEQFDRMKKRGYAAFKVEGKDGAKGEQMLEFDKNAERVIYVKQMRGG